MKYSFLLAFLANVLLCHSQQYVVEKVPLTETIENKFLSEIPRLKDQSNESNPVVDQINSQILDRFMINSYEQSEVGDFRWNEVNFSSEIQENILYIGFTGEYIGAYPNYIEDELYFDLQSGASLKLTVIPFQAMFTLSGYLDFLNRYWLEGVKKEFVTAVECAEMEPYCSYFDITKYEPENNKLSISLTDDCFPHVAQGCSPSYSVSVELDSIKQYLNKTGKYMLLESNYFSLSQIEKFQKNIQITEKIARNVYLFGKIADKYPISMAINLDNPGNISGLYYYDAKWQKINLEGLIKEDTMFLTETVNNKPTGLFQLAVNVENEPIEGKWMNPEKTKSLNVTFTKIIPCKND